MREGILDQLPKTLTKETVVLVVGPDQYPGLNHVKALIQDLNREEKWIRDEFRTDVSDSQVSNKVGIILTLVGTKHGSLSNVRRAAKNLNACCPNQALTIAETKDILTRLADLRKGVAPPQTLPGAHNGNGSHPVPGAGEGQRLDRLRTSAQESSKEFIAVVTQPLPQPDSPTTAAQMTASAETGEPEELDAALTALDTFGSAFAEAQDAVLMVGDRLKAVMAERDQFQRQLATKDGEIADLRSQLGKTADLTKENGILIAKNKELQTEVQRLQQAFDNLESLIKGARKK